MPPDRAGRNHDTRFFFYTALDYPYTPSDIRPMLDRIHVRDEFLGKQPDLISGCRTGLPTPVLVKWSGRAWRLFWRRLRRPADSEPPPWHGGRRAGTASGRDWVYGVPFADVNSCFKLFRTAFLKRFPIQSNGDFVHTELVAKATFLTSIMDEVPLTPKPDPHPAARAIREPTAAGVRRSALRLTRPKPRSQHAGSRPPPFIARPSPDPAPAPPLS